MKTNVGWLCLLGLLLTLSVGPAFAGNTSDDESIARLQTLLEQQQRQIEALEQQVAATQTANLDATRLNVMKAQLREVLSQQEFREQAMPSMLQAGYDNGFFIRSSDDKFLLRMNAGMQFRYTYYNTRDQNRSVLPRVRRDDRSGFDMQRIMMAFGGHAYNEDLTYYIRFRADAPNGYNVVASEAWANYRLMDEIQFRAGIMRLPSTRAQSIDEFNQQFIDRSMVDSIFGLGYGVGVEFWGQCMDKRIEWHATVANATSDGENYAAGTVITPDPASLDGNPALLLRLVWHAMGEDPEHDFVKLYDREHRESPALDFGFHYAFNDVYGDAAFTTTRIPYPRRGLLPGGYGLTTTQGLQLHQFGFDGAFKYGGFSASGEYVLRFVDVRRAGRTPFAPWWLLTGEESTTPQHGGVAQIGYFLPIPGWENKLEAVARVGVFQARAEGTETTWEYTLGMNYYIEDGVKLQMDATRVEEAPITSSYSSLANVNDDALVFRVQLQVTF